MSEVTRILNSCSPEDPRGGGAAEELLPLIYQELRRLAASQSEISATASESEYWFNVRLASGGNFSTQARWIQAWVSRR